MKTKRLFGKGKLLIALFAFILVSCGGDIETKDDLAAHKENAIAILTAYVEALNPDDYSDVFWAVIKSIANSGKVLINNAAVCRQDVDFFLAEAKNRIGVVPNKETEHLLPEFQIAAIAELLAYVEALDPNDYSDENWAAIIEGKNWGIGRILLAVNESNVDGAMRDTMRGLQILVAGRGFVFTISVEETTIQQGGNFIVNVELKNNTEEDHVIYYDYLFWPFIPNWDIRTEKWIPTRGWQFHDRSRSFEAGSILKNIETLGFPSGPRSLGATLTPGTYELIFEALFTFRGRPGVGQMVRVWSNTVVLTVE